MMFNKKIFFFLCLCLFLIPFTCVFADVDVYYFGDGGISSGGGGGGGGTNSFYGYLGYRMTLVDSNGVKVNGTSSVDFVHSSFAQKVQKDKLIFGNKYKYRFGDNDSEYIAIGLDELPFENGVYDPDAHSEFVNKYILKFNENAVFSVSDKNVKVDFISLFLYHSKFIEKNNLTLKTYDQLINDYEDLKNYFISVELLVGLGTSQSSSVLYRIATGSEALEYMLSGSDVYLRNTYRDNMANEKLSFACGLFTTSKFKEKYSNFNRFNNFFDSYEDCVRKTLTNYTEGSYGYIWTGNSCKTVNGWAYGIQGLLCGGVQQYGSGVQMDNLNNFNNNKNNYAVGVAMISMNITNTPKPKNSTLKLCSDNEVSFGASFKDDILGNSMFKQIDGADANENIYCYDSVTYNYSKVVKSLGGEKNQGFEIGVSSPNSPVITAEVIRKCYSNNEMSLDYNVLEKIMKDYEKNITVNVYGNNYVFTPKFVNSIETSEHTNYFSSKYSFEYRLTSPIRYEGSSSGKAYIDFSNYSTMFGASNEFIKTMVNLPDGKCDGFKADTKKCLNSFGLSSNLDFSSNSDGKCEFSYNIKSSKSKSYYKFRVISLDNPFPGRDGTSRMPAKNWFYNENYVYDYILNNRGIGRCGTLSEKCLTSVSPEQMYSEVEPMYRIVLTPSTMLDIREYNKSYSYYSMYDVSSDYYTNYEDLRTRDASADKLICDSEGRQCYSQFLRDDKVIPQKDGELYDRTGSLTGSCVLIKNKDVYSDKTIRDGLSQYKVYDDTYDLQFLHNYLYGVNADNGYAGIIKYDVNYNNRVDNMDYEIISQYKNDKISELPGKNTWYYTCANKSYFSGGPVKVGGD